MWLVFLIDWDYWEFPLDPRIWNPIENSENQKKQSSPRLIQKREGPMTKWEEEALRRKKCIMVSTGIIIVLHSSLIKRGM